MTTLADLMVRAHHYRNTMPDREFKITRKAVLRVAESAGLPLQDVGGHDVVGAHARLADQLSIRKDQYKEEHKLLGQLAALPPLCPELSRRIFAGKATIADALLAIELQKEPDAWSQVATALKSLAKGLGGGLGTVVGGRKIEGILANHSHIDFGLRESTWKARKALIRRGVRLVDLEPQQKFRASMLSGAWRDLIEAANPKRGQKGTQSRNKGLGHHVAKLWPLVRYCWREGIEATQVDDRVIEQLLSDFEVRDIKDPFCTARDIIYAWEKLQAEVPGWPQQKLSRLYRSRATSSPHRLQMEDLPVALQADWQAYAERTFEGAVEAPASLAVLVAGAGAIDDDPLADLLGKDGADIDKAAGAGGARRCAESLPNFRTVFLYAANAAINELGMTPQSLVEVLAPDVLNRVIAARHKRQKRRSADKDEPLVPSIRNRTLLNTAWIFRSMAIDIGVAQGVIDKIDKYRNLVDPDIVGWKTKDGVSMPIYSDVRIGDRRRKILEQFTKEDAALKLFTWFRLPVDLFEGVKRRYAAVGARGLSDEEIGDLITAIVGLIMRSCPLRRENLGELRIGPCKTKNLGPNLYLPRHGEREGRIHLWAGEIKKGSKDLEVWLTPLATQCLKFYLERIRPEVLRRRKSHPDNPYLFPAAGLKHRALGLITKHWVKRCKRVGLNMDLHVNRHLTAKIVLDRDVTAMALMQRILGHKKIETTQSYYAEVDDALAQKEFQKHLEEAEKSLSKALLVNLRSVE